MRISGRAIERHDTASAWLPIDGHLAAMAGLQLPPTRRHSAGTVTSIQEGRWPLNVIFGAHLARLAA